MHHLIVSYGHPEDPAAFDEYYNRIHRPLADKIPGVRAWRAGRATALDQSLPPYYFIAVLDFVSRQALEAGLASVEGQSAAADIANFATGGATLTVMDNFIPAH